MPRSRALERAAGQALRPTLRALGTIFLIVGVVGIVRGVLLGDGRLPNGPLDAGVVLGFAADPSARAAARPPPLVPLAVVVPFRAPTGPYTAGHRGVDLGGDPGASVVATLPGRVVFAGSVGGVGVLSLDIGGGWRLSYEPITPAVVEGDLVRPGQQLGTLVAGHPGCPVTACLHWGLIVRAGPPRIYADPMSLLEHGQVRLLPWEGEPVPGG